MQLNSPTLGRLITNIRNMLNQRNPANSFWTDAELTEYINEGIRLYFQEVVLNNEGLFAATPVALDITSGVETIALPTDCYEVRVLYKKITNGYIGLPYQNDITGSYSTVSGGGSDSFLPSYHFQNNNIVLRPVPTFTEVGGLRLEYLQFPDTLINGGDVMTSQVSPVFKQLIERYAVYLAKLKESMVNGVVMHKVAEESLSQIYELFKESIMNRSKYQQYVQPFNPEGSN